MDVSGTPFFGEILPRVRFCLSLSLCCLARLSNKTQHAAEIPAEGDGPMPEFRRDGTAFQPKALNEMRWVTWYVWDPGKTNPLEATVGSVQART